MSPEQRQPRAARHGRPRTADAAQADAHLERLLDEALADTFPASDPVSTLIQDEPPPAKPGQEASAPTPQR
jgi:hypothetical protein